MDKKLLKATISLIENLKESLDLLDEADCDCCTPDDPCGMCPCHEMYVLEQLKRVGGDEKPKH